MAAVALAIGGGGALSSFETTVLLDCRRNHGCSTQGQRSWVPRAGRVRVARSSRETARRLPSRVRVLGAALARDRRARRADRRRRCARSRSRTSRSPARSGGCAGSAAARTATRRSRSSAASFPASSSRTYPRRASSSGSPGSSGGCAAARPDRPTTADEFLAYSRPDTCKAVIDFRVGHASLSTETRVHVADPAPAGSSGATGSSSGRSAG